MKRRWSELPSKKTRTKTYISSNDQYTIIKNKNPNEIELFARYQTSSIFDLAETIYSDCITLLQLSVPLTCYVTFYNSRNYYTKFVIEKSQSREDVLKEITSKLFL